MRIPPHGNTVEFLLYALSGEYACRSHAAVLRCPRLAQIGEAAERICNIEPQVFTARAGNEAHCSGCFGSCDSLWWGSASFAGKWVSFFKLCMWLLLRSAKIIAAKMVYPAWIVGAASLALHEDGQGKVGKVMVEKVCPRSHECIAYDLVAPTLLSRPERALSEASGVHPSINHYSSSIDHGDYQAR